MCTLCATDATLHQDVANRNSHEMMLFPVGSTIACKVCQRSILVEFTYHQIGVCGSCVRALGHEYSMEHSGEPSIMFSSEDQIAAYKALPKPYKKAQIPARLRKAVFVRDGYRCRKCGSEADLQADHIFPEFLGGETTLSNLQTLCKPCNRKKGYSLPEARSK